jgi:outer membrane receptor protein involved in Fe transport
VQPDALAAEQPPVHYTVDVVAALPRTAASSTTLRHERFAHTFVDSPADVLRAVPGLVIAQHAGGGKADQYLIRGFDADHGTDVALFVDGVPVNLVSHAHGQGYADLHFLIPETLDRIDVYKGPYFAEYGNLATAAAVELGTRERLDRSFVRVQGGSFDTGRFSFGLSPAHTPGWIAGEAVFTNGPFRHAQNVHRLNVAARWRFTPREGDVLTVGALGHDGRWNASGQIPARLVEAGALDRFGAVDPSEGGRTRRFQGWTSYTTRRGLTSLAAQAYAVGYDLDLYSNFTFFAVDPERGDGILQRDRRAVMGGRIRASRPFVAGGRPIVLTAGADIRRDAINVGLARQVRREVFGTIVDSRVSERNVAVFGQAEIVLGPRARVVTGLRHERFAFGVRDLTAGALVRRASPSWTGPKVSVVVAPIGEGSFELFTNYGRGLHSNDARATVEDGTQVRLPSANGYEVGVRRRLGRRFELSAAYWLLDLDGELRWVGDEGVTELAGATRRHGFEFEGRWQVIPGVWTDLDLTRSTGFYRDTGEAIARAPRLTWSAGLVVADRRGWSAEIGGRHVGDHPAVEDRSRNAAGFTVVDLTVRRRLSARWEATATVDNLLDADVREAQTFFGSRLRNEARPVDDIHFTPGNPRAIRVGFQYSFDWR